jgi:signal transduction histidine kinase
MTNLSGIIVADSEQFIKKIVTPLHLQNVQLRLDVAESEDSCMRKLEAHNFDILIVYHHIPAIDILRLTRTVTSRHFPVEILVIAPAGHEEILNQCVMEGAFAYFIDTSNRYEVIPHLINRMIQSLTVEQGRAEGRTGQGGEQIAQGEGKPSPCEELSSLTYQDKLKILDRLTSFISHELKNPFTTINNALYFLQKKISDQQVDPVFQKYIQIIEMEINSSNKFLSTLLSITRKTQINQVPLQVNEILTETVRQIPVSQKVKVIYELDPLIPISLIDPEQIQAAFSQIIRNSIQAMPEGGELTIRTAYAQRVVEIHIIDQGEGIKPDHLPHIFEAFFTTKIRNVGLGLTIAQNLIEANGGQILVDSTPGQGVKCTILLPHS